MSYSEEKRMVVCNGEKIEYTLIIKSVKNINLYVKLDGKIYVSANKRVSKKYIDSFIVSKQDFIFKARKHFEELRKNMPAKKQYIDGESMYILGKTLYIKVIDGSDEKAEFDEEFIYLTVKEKENFKSREKIINEWLDKLCEEIFIRICDELYPKFEKLGVDYPVVRIKSMKSRWGSCMPQKGIITLNKSLIFKPIRCIEYVVLHEFSHFIYPNHSKKFYAFVEKLMPDWKERKVELNKDVLLNNLQSR